MSHSNTQPSSFLVKNLPLLESLQIQCGVLDLACGHGRNGLFLLTHNVPVIFADNNETKLQSILPTLDSVAAGAISSECWLVDFELEDNNPLADKSFDAILVFNYLHRPLFASIKEAIRPGGLIVYETFTVEQRQFGRPSNPDFLLSPGELIQEFSDWEMVESFEGVVPGPDRAVARLIARKPIL
jgi:SAM-dependent methyltransferase